jgi:hypothetical protein
MPCDAVSDGISLSGKPGFAQHRPIVGMGKAPVFKLPNGVARLIEHAAHIAEDLPHCLGLRDCRNVPSALPVQFSDQVHQPCLVARSP